MSNGTTSLSASVTTRRIRLTSAVKGSSPDTSHRRTTGVTQLPATASRSLRSRRSCALPKTTSVESA